MQRPHFEPDEPPVLVLTKHARRRLLGAALTLSALLALPYAVPSLASLRPWQPGGAYVPFWNVTARYEVEAEERQEQERVADFEALATEAERSAGEQPSEPNSEEPEAAGDEAAQDEPAQRAPAAAAERSPEPESLDAPTTIAELGADADRQRDALVEEGAESRVYPAYAGHRDETHPVQMRIENPKALEHFFGQLALTELKRPGAITRAGHWGDSVLGGDGLTHALRSLLQERFGDAGHGFHALSKYSIGYRHKGVRFQDRGGWRSCEIIFKCRPDQRYGYAGVSSGSTGGGVSEWQTAKRGPGSRVSRFELWYAKGPEGGRFQVSIDGKPRVIETRAPALADAVEVFEVPDGPHHFEVRAIGNGTSRGYGVVLERDVPGVVWDELSLIGSFTQRLDYQDPEHLAWQLQRRDVDLMVFIFGGNDVQREFDDLKVSMERYEAEYTRVLRKFRAGRPEASCLIMSLIDHGVRTNDGVVTRGIVPRLVESQRKVAGEQGCAFFDTFHAMGGENSIARWFRARPQLAAPDFSHPTAAGQGVIATLLYRALMHDYADFRDRQAGKPLPELSVQSASVLVPAAGASDAER